MLGVLPATAPPLCGHDERLGGGFIAYEDPRPTLLDRLLRRPPRYRYCQSCAGAITRLCRGYWEGRLSLAEVEASLRTLNIHDSEHELRVFLRELRAFPMEDRHVPAA